MGNGNAQPLRDNVTALGFNYLRESLACIGCHDCNIDRACLRVKKKDCLLGKNKS